MTDRSRPRSRGFLLFAVAILAVFGTLGALLWPADGGGLGALPVMSTGLGLLRGTLAAFMAWITSRALDHIGAALPGPMSAAFAVILSDPRAAGIYYGLRFAGLCYLYAGVR